MENCNKKTAAHPCFSASGYLKYARIHLPVAPKCNIKCNYCNIKYDCINESRPGVASRILTPEQALQKFLEAKEKINNLTVVGFAGPGDALENFDEIRKTIALIKQKSTETIFCLSTNGLRLPEFAQEIIDMGISHVTVTINTIDVKTAKLIYSGINPEILLKNQLTGLEYLAKRGIICKVNIVAIKGINDTHIEEVVKKAKELGAFKTNIMQLVPVKGTKFENIPVISLKELSEIRKKCSAHLKQMKHCKRCRADAAGYLYNTNKNFVIN